MERHLRMSTESTTRSEEEGTPEIGVIQPDAAFNRNRNIAAAGSGQAWPARDHQPHPLAESVSVRMHTLIPTGELTHRSTHTLEVEIERLFEEGVTSIVLDLRRLTSIDPIGVSVIAFRCRLCKRQGNSIVLIPGPPPIQRAFAEAGVIDRLPFQEDELAARRLRAAAASSAGS
jgi:anti-anti-sigma factor